MLLTRHGHEPFEEGCGTLAYICLGEALPKVGRICLCSGADLPLERALTSPDNETLSVETMGTFLPEGQMRSRQQEAEADLDSNIRGPR